MRRYLPFLIIGAVFLITAGGGLLLYREKHSSTPLKIASGSPGAEPSHVRGLANARVTLEEFGDFQCPPCGNLAAILLKVEHDYGMNIRVVFREFPLAMHAHALTAAYAAEAAGLQGHFWEMHDLLFENALTWSKEPAHTAPNAAPDEAAMGVRSVFNGYAAKLGLDVERFKRDMDGQMVKTRIAEDQDRAASIGVDRTPILFMDGVQIPFAYLMSIEALRPVIDGGLKGETPAPAPTPTPESAPLP